MAGLDPAIHRASVRERIESLRRADARRMDGRHRGGHDGCAGAKLVKANSMKQSSARQLVVCIENDGYAASLEKRKIYVGLRDQAAEKHGLLRVMAAA